MIELRPDWCVSRQRVWGVPIPVFMSKKSNEVLVDDEVTENIANIFEKEGADCWFEGDAQRFLGKKYKIEDYEKMTDIVEVWFDSGSTHAYVLEKREDLKWPASMYLFFFSGLGLIILKLYFFSKNFNLFTFPFLLLPNLKLLLTNYK